MSVLTASDDLGQLRYRQGDSVGICFSAFGPLNMGPMKETTDCAPHEATFSKPAS